MRNRIARNAALGWAWALAGCAIYDGALDPSHVPLDRIREERRSDVRDILQSDPVAIALPRTMVESRFDVYEFLLEELPFTASVVRALGKGNYDIFHKSVAPGETQKERERRERTFFMNDRAGMEVAAELVFHEEGKWIYYVWGRYSFLIAPIRGTAVIVMTARETGKSLETEARVFLPVAHVAAPILEGIVQEKAALFIEAARTMAEETARDPQSLLRSARGAPGVDEEVLKRFEARFILR